MDKVIIENHFSRTAAIWDKSIYKPRSSQGIFEYFDKQYRFDYTVEMIPSPANRDSAALDIGCGAGQLAPILCGMGYKITAFDVSQEMVDLTAARCKTAGFKADVLVADVEKMKFSDNSFDVAVAMGVIEYMTTNAPMLKEIKRVLKPGGVAIVTMRNAECFYITWHTFYKRTIETFLINLKRKITGKAPYKYMAISKRHSPSEIKQEIKNLGFELVTENYNHFHVLPYPVSKWLFFVQAIGGKLLEPIFRKGGLSWFASSYIVKFRKPQV